MLKQLSTVIDILHFPRYRFLVTNRYLKCKDIPSFVRAFLTLSKKNTRIGLQSLLGYGY